MLLWLQGKSPGKSSVADAAAEVEAPAADEGACCEILLTALVM